MTHDIAALPQSGLELHGINPDIPSIRNPDHSPGRLGRPFLLGYILRRGGHSPQNDVCRAALPDNRQAWTGQQAQKKKGIGSPDDWTSPGGGWNILLRSNIREL